MNLHSSKYPLVVAILFFSLIIKAQSRLDPSINVNDAGGGDFSFFINNLPKLDDEHATKEAHYGIFWIFKNGNYINVKDVPNPRKEPQIPINTQLPDIKGEPDSVFAFLTEYYTNHEPPPDIDPEGLGAMSGTPPPTSSDPDRIDMHPYTGSGAPLQGHDIPGNIYVEASVDSIVGGRKIIFAISYKMLKNEGQLHFFFNARNNNSRGLDPTPGDFSIDKVISPYYDDVSNIVTTNAKYDNYGGWEGRLNNFGSVLSYNINKLAYDPDGDPDNGIGHNEGRLFIVMDVASGLTIKDEYVFFAAITEDNQPVNNFDSRADRAYLTGSGQVGLSSSLLPDVKITTTKPEIIENISGFQYIEKVVTKTHDPNKLCLTNICECKTRKKKDKKYQIEYTFTFCNDTITKVNKRAQIATLTFRDTNEIFECFNLESNTRGKVYFESKERFIQDRPQIIKQIKFTELDLYPAVEGLAKDSSCSTIKFTMNLKEEYNNIVYDCDIPFEFEIDVKFRDDSETGRIESQECLRCDIATEIVYSLDSIPQVSYYNQGIKDKYLQNQMIKKCRRIYGLKRYKDTCKCVEKPRRKKWRFFIFAAAVAVGAKYLYDRR